MNTRGLLDQLLKSGQDLLQQKSGGSSSGGLGGLLGSVAGGGKSGGGDLGTLLKGAGGGALAAGALGQKAGAGFYKKVGKDILRLDFASGEYVAGGGKAADIAQWNGLR